MDQKQQQIAAENARKEIERLEDIKRREQERILEVHIADITLSILIVPKVEDFTDIGDTFGFDSLEYDRIGIHNLSGFGNCIIIKSLVSVFSYQT